jgi:hypothetical protein
MMFAIQREYVTQVGLVADTSCLPISTRKHDAVTFSGRDSYWNLARLKRLLRRHQGASGG